MVIIRFHFLGRITKAADVSFDCMMKSTKFVSRTSEAKIMSGDGPSILAEEEISWRCITCSFENHAAMLSCELCCQINDPMKVLARISDLQTVRASTFGGSFISHDNSHDSTIDSLGTKGLVRLAALVVYSSCENEIDWTTWGLPFIELLVGHCPNSVEFIEEIKLAFSTMSGKLVLEALEDSGQESQFLVVKYMEDYISETAALIDEELTEEEILSSLQTFVHVVNRQGDYGPKSRSVVSNYELFRYVLYIMNMT